MDYVGRAFRRLRSLGISSYNVTSARALSGLKDFEALCWLNLEGTAVKDSIMKVLRDVPNLKAVALSHTEVSDAAVEQLRQDRPELEVLFKRYRCWE